MNTQDLMIGDWVVDAGENTRVASLTCDGIIETTLRISNVDDVGPIPLTSEILKKNGFIPRESGWYIPNTPRLDMGILSFGIDDGCGTGFSQMPDGDFVFFSKYVHELQHALRLCGIEKEIVI